MKEIKGNIASWWFKDGGFVDNPTGRIGDITPEVLAVIGEYVIGSPYRLVYGIGGCIKHEYGVWLVGGSAAMLIAEFPNEQAATDYAIYKNAVAHTKTEGKLDLEKLATEMGGKLDSVSVPLPDGSGFFTISFPLPKTHWLYKEDEGGYEEPPMPFRRGVDEPDRQEWVEKLKIAARWAVKHSTGNGTIDDFDPDAMVTNFVIACVGFWTEDGRGSS
jgi:hypothetical protein